MKKILCFILAFVMLLGICATANAAEEYTDLEQKFYNYCLEVLPEDMKPSQTDSVKITFSHETEGFTLFGAASVSAVSDTENFKYKDAVIQKVDETYHFLDGSNSFKLACYREDYEYYSPENVASGDEATPDYVLITFFFDGALQSPYTYIFGDYVMVDESVTKIPYYFGKCIYVPTENVIYSLLEAYETNKIDGIENIFTEAGLGILMGDVDRDRKLTIKDATQIQQCIAGIDQFSNDDNAGMVPNHDNTRYESVFISDFNRDGERNIKDATAIQKYIAGLPY